MIYSGVIEDEFLGWREALYACFYTAIMTSLTKNKPIATAKINDMLKQLKPIDDLVVDQPQMLNNKFGHFSEHRSTNPREIMFPDNLSLIVAHSLTPLPKKLIQGKRFNLRRCEILIAL